MNKRGKAAFTAVIFLVVFLLGDLLHKAEQLSDSNKVRDATIAELQKTNQGIVAKLTEILSVPGVDTQKVIDSVKNFVSPALIQQAVDNAAKNIKPVPGPPGPQGQQGKQGPAGQSASSNPSSTTTTTQKQSTTSSTSTTTTRPPSTTTTTSRPRPCVVQLLGVKICNG